MTPPEKRLNKSGTGVLLSAAFSLGVLGLLAALPVEAQQLTVGGSAPGMAAVSGAGTAASGTYAFADGAGPGTTHYKEVDVSGGAQTAFTDPPDLTLQAGGTIDTLHPERPDRRHRRKLGECDLRRRTPESAGRIRSKHQRP